MENQKGEDKIKNLILTHPFVVRKDFISCSIRSSETRLYEHFSLKPGK